MGCSFHNQTVTTHQLLISLRPSICRVAFSGEGRQSNSVGQPKCWLMWENTHWSLWLTRWILKEGECTGASLAQIIHMCVYCKSRNVGVPLILAKLARSGFSAKIKASANEQVEAEITSQDLRRKWGRYYRYSPEVHAKWPSTQHGNKASSRQLAYNSCNHPAGKHIFYC